MITILYDNYPFDTRLRTAWGFACVVQEQSETILFDTGGKGRLLLANMAAAGFQPDQIDHVVLSHPHSDHTGGLKAFLRANHRVKVFLPAAFPAAFKAKVRRSAAAVVETVGPCAVYEGAWTTGVLDAGIPEQALRVTTARGPVVITGCAHPGLVQMVDAARRHAGSPIHAVVGGCHMGGASAAEVDAAVAGLREAGVQQIAPSHCSGDGTRKLMKRAFGSGYLASGVGARLVFGHQEPEERP